MTYTKLNVGSRDVIKPADEGWLNIDLEPLPKPRDNFIVADALHLPDEWAGQFQEIHAVHVLEHINRNYRQDFLREMYRVTAPGGSCYIEVPNFKETIALLHAAFVNGDAHQQHIWTTSIYGKQRSPGDQHCWGYTNGTLGDLFVEAGFNVFAWDSFYKHPEGWNKFLAPISTHYRAEPVLLGKGMKL